jgi:HK97 family phage portal protein
MLAWLRTWLGLALERRSVDYADPVLGYLTGGSRTASGEPVSLERAVALTALWSCVNLIAGSIASLPLLLYRRVDDERERASEHPLFDVLKTRPNPVQSVVSFWEAMVTALLLRGNSFATLTRDDDGRVRAMWYVNPDRVQVEVLRTAKLRYKINTGGATQTVDAGNMLHVVGPLSDDGYLGRSVISTFRETLGLGLALERYGSEFFSNAATPSGIVTHPGKLSEAALKHLRAEFDAQQVTRGRRHRPLLFQEGMKFDPIGVSHEDSQFMEAKRFTTEEIARIFGVPPAMIGGDTKGSMTYANAETRALDFLKFCLGPWLARIESAVNFACISPLERRQMYCEFLPDSLLSTDTTGRYSAYKTGLEAGFLTIDEVRQKENLPALTRVDSEPDAFARGLVVIEKTVTERDGDGRAQTTRETYTREGAADALVIEKHVTERDDHGRAQKVREVRTRTPVKSFLVEAPSATRDHVPAIG